MPQDDIDKIMRALSERGASVRVDDPRITRATNWLLGTIALGLLGGFWSILESVNQLKEQNATLIAEVRFQQQVNEAQDSRLSIYDERLRAVERATR